MRLVEFRIEFISWRIRNFTLGLNGQDYSIIDENDNEVDCHSFTIGLFFVRFTFEFEYV